jgi:hypothetical protein
MRRTLTAGMALYDFDWQVRANRHERSGDPWGAAVSFGPLATHEVTK